MTKKSPNQRAKEDPRFVDRLAEAQKYLSTDDASHVIDQRRKCRNALLIGFIPSVGLIVFTIFIFTGTVSNQNLLPEKPLTYAVLILVGLLATFFALVCMIGYGYRYITAEGTVKYEWREQYDFYTEAIADHPEQCAELLRQREIAKKPKPTYESQDDALAAIDSTLEGLAAEDRDALSIRRSP